MEWFPDYYLLFHIKPPMWDSSMLLNVDKEIQTQDAQGFSI